MLKGQETRLKRALPEVETVKDPDGPDDGERESCIVEKVRDGGETACDGRTDCDGVGNEGNGDATERNALADGELNEDCGAISATSRAISPEMLKRAEVIVRRKTATRAIDVAIMRRLARTLESLSSRMSDYVRHRRQATRNTQRVVAARKAMTNVVQDAGAD